MSIAAITPLSSFVAMPEDAYNNVLRAANALEALAYFSIEVADKAIGNPNKDEFVSLPAEGMGALLLCIHHQMGGNRLMFKTVPTLLQEHSVGASA